MSRIEELLEQLVEQNSQIIDRLGDIAISLDAVQQEMDGTKANSSFSRIEMELSSVADDVRAIEENTANIDLNMRPQ